MYDLPPPPDYAEYDDAHRRDSGIYSTINESEQGKLFTKSYLIIDYWITKATAMNCDRCGGPNSICKFKNVFV